MEMWIAISFPLILWLLLNISEHSKNFKSEDMQIPIEGKNCIVTGANSGIGYATAEGLAARYVSCLISVFGFVSCNLI